MIDKIRDAAARTCGFQDFLSMAKAARKDPKIREEYMTIKHGTAFAPGGISYEKLYSLATKAADIVAGATKYRVVQRLGVVTTASDVVQATSSGAALARVIDQRYPGTEPPRGTSWVVQRVRR